MTGDYPWGQDFLNWLAKRTPNWDALCHVFNSQDFKQLRNAFEETAQFHAARAKDLEDALRHVSSNLSFIIERTRCGLCEQLRQRVDEILERYSEANQIVTVTPEGRNERIESALPDRDGAEGWDQMTAEEYQAHFSDTTPPFGG